MMITILVYSAFTGLSALSQSWYDFALYRFICGMGIGGEYAAGVALVAETVSPRARPSAWGCYKDSLRWDRFPGLSSASRSDLKQSSTESLAGDCCSWSGCFRHCW